MKNPLLLLAALPLTQALPNACRCTPNNPCWPSDEKWAALNESVAGNLVAVRPVADPCHEPDFDEAACKEVKKNGKNSIWRAGQPGAVQWENWEDWPARNEACHMETPESVPCLQGRVSLYSVTAENADHVAEAVKFAKEHNLRLAIKSTGHDFAGKSSAPHSLQISTNRLKDVRVIEDFVPKGCEDKDNKATCSEGPAVNLQAGAFLKEIYTQLAPKNRTVVAGLSHTVSGAGGYIQGGGHSPLGPWKGMASDNALEFEVVTANGDIVAANQYENADLFWALRGGGGGSFGVVVSVTVRSYPDVPVILASLSVNVTLDNVDAYWDAVKEIHTHLPKISDAGGSGYYFLTPVPIPDPKKPEQQATATAAFIFANQTDKGAIDNLFEPLVTSINKIPDAKAGMLNTPLPSLQIMFEVLLPGDADLGVGSQFAFGSRMVSRDFLLSDDGPSRLSEVMSQLARTPGRQHTGHVVGGGQVAANAESISSALNPAWRSTLTHITAGTGWSVNTTFEERAEIYKNITEVEGPLLRDLEPHMGAYLNEADAYTPEFQTTFWGENYDKLAEIKKAWDPCDLFIVRQGVGSERWDEDGLCRAHK